MKNTDRERFEEAVRSGSFTYSEKFKGSKPAARRASGVEKIVDLHGFTRESAEDLIITSLKSNLHTKTGTIRIICGRGLHSQGEPVLREHAERVLKKMKDYYFEYTVDFNNNITVYMREK